MTEDQNNDIIELTTYIDQERICLCNPAHSRFFGISNLSNDLQGFSSLQKISFCNLMFDDRLGTFRNIFNALKNHKNLQELDISGNTLSDDSFAALCDLIKEIELKKLIISPIQFTAQQLECLNRTVKFKMVSKTITSTLCWGAYTRDTRTFHQNLQAPVLEYIGAVTYDNSRDIERFKPNKKFSLKYR